MTVACTRKTDIHDNSYLSLQDGSTLFFGSERLFEYIDVLFAVRKLIGERLQFSLQAQELSVLPGEILLHLVNLCKTNICSKYVKNSPETPLQTRPPSSGQISRTTFPPKTPLQNTNAAMFCFKSIKNNEICSHRTDVGIKH